MENKIKLVITHPSQLSERWVNYYCLEELTKVFDVEFWDCSALAYPSFTVAHPLSPDYLRVIHTLKEFAEKMMNLPKDTVLITEVHHNAKTYQFHKIQGHHFPHYAHINFYGNDIDRIWEDEKLSQQERKLKGIKSFLYQSKLIRDFSKWLFHHRDANYHDNKMKAKCADCYKMCFSLSCVGSSDHRINHPDFEQYLAVKELPRLIKEPYIVFIDDYYPYHPECRLYNGDDVDVIAKVYHNTMNEFFEFVESQFQCKVVIAAHPYANYLENNPFNGRNVFYGKTAQLIKDCKAVCMHCSNAFSYVTLFDKPIAFITNAALDISNIGSGTHIYSQKFEMPTVYTDNHSKYPHPIFMKVNLDLRIKYIKDYLGNIDYPQLNSKLIQKYIREFHEILIAAGVPL